MRTLNVKFAVAHSHYGLRLVSKFKSNWCFESCSLSSPCKNILIHLVKGKAIHCFSFSMFPKITLLCSNPIQKHVSKSPTANSFQNMLCPRKILCLSPTKSYIYSTTTLTEENYSLMCTTKKRETYIYTYQSAHINKSKSQKCVNIQPKIWNSK